MPLTLAGAAYVDNSNDDGKEDGSENEEILELEESGGLKSIRTLSIAVQPACLYSLFGPYGLFPGLFRYIYASFSSPFIVFHIPSVYQTVSLVISMSSVVPTSLIKTVRKSGYEQINIINPLLAVLRWSMAEG